MTNDELHSKTKLAEIKHYAMAKNGYISSESSYVESAKALASLYAQEPTRPILIPLGSKYTPVMFSTLHMLVNRRLEQRRKDIRKQQQKSARILIILLAVIFCATVLWKLLI